MKEELKDLILLPVSVFLACPSAYVVALGMLVLCSYLAD